MPDQVETTPTGEVESGMTQKAFSEHLHDSLEAIQDWDKEALDDYRMMGLKQWNSTDVENLSEEGRPALTYDRLRPLVQSVAGTQMTNRYQSTFVAREYTLDDIDRFVSKGAREWARWVQQVGDWEHQESLAFFDNLTCGFGVLEMFMAYDIDPDGRIMLRRRPPWEVLWDPASVEPNMKDATYIISDKWMLNDELAAIFGEDAVEEVIRMAESMTATPRREGFWKGLFTTKTTEQRHAYDLRRPPDWDDKFYDPRRSRVRLFQMERFQRTYKVRIISPDLRDESIESTMQAVMAGQPAPRIDTFEEPRRAKELMSEMQEKVLTLNAQMSPDGMTTTGALKDPVAIDDFPVREYYRSYHTRAAMLKEEKLPYDGFSHLFMTCHEDWSDESGARHFFGLVRQGKDPQKALNKFLSQMVHLFNANPKGALVYEEGAFKDKQRLTEEWNKATGLIPIEDGSFQMPNKPFEHITTQVSLNQAHELMNVSAGAVSSALGMSEAVALGAVQDVRRVSGDALSSMMEQNVKTQASPFDSLRLYRKMGGRLLLGFTDAYADPDQVLRVVGQDDAAFVQALETGELQQEFDVIAEESPTEVNEREEMFTVLSESGIITQLVSQGVPIPPAMAELFPGDPELIGELKQVFQQAYEVQMLNLEVQKLQAQAMMQNGGQPPPQPGQPPPAEGQPPGGDQVQ